MSRRFEVVAGLPVVGFAIIDAERDPFSVVCAVSGYQADERGTRVARALNAAADVYDRSIFDEDPTAGIHEAGNALARIIRAAMNQRPAGVRSFHVDFDDAELADALVATILEDPKPIVDEEPF